MTTKINSINLERFKNTALLSITLRRPGNTAKIKDAAALENYLAELNQPTPDGETTTTAPAVEGITASAAKNIKAGKRINAWWHRPRWTQPTAF
jgi:hypothetical protein